MKRTPRRLVAVIAALLVAGPLVATLSPTGFVPTEITYRVALVGASVDSVDLAIHSVTLVECPDETGGDRGWFERLRSLVGGVAAGPVAFAGHGADEDPAAVEGTWVVAGGDGIMTLETHDTAQTSDASYCEVHLGFAERAPGAATNDGPTLRAAVGTDSFSTEVSWGVLLAITDTDGALTTIRPDGPIDVVIVLDTGDAVPAGDTGDERARDLLRSIGEHSSATVEPSQL